MTELLTDLVELSVDLAGGLAWSVGTALLGVALLGVYGLTRAWQRGTLDEDAAGLIRLTGEMGGIVLAIALLGAGSGLVLLTIVGALRLLAWFMGG